MTSNPALTDCLMWAMPWAHLLALRWP